MCEIGTRYAVLQTYILKMLVELLVLYFYHVLPFPHDFFEFFFSQTFVWFHFSSCPEIRYSSQEIIEKPSLRSLYGELGHLCKVELVSIASILSEGFTTSPAFINLRRFRSLSFCLWTKRRPLPFIAIASLNVFAEEIPSISHSLFGLHGSFGIFFGSEDKLWTEVIFTQVENSKISFKY